MTFCSEEKLNHHRSLSEHTHGHHDLSMHAVHCTCDAPARRSTYGVVFWLCRVIALAYKQLDGSTNASGLRTMPRAEIEKDLCFGGFAVLRCPLKAESEPALKMLKESSHQLVMITGDAPLTACYTAAQVHIVDRPVLLLVHRYALSDCVLRRLMPGLG